MTTLQEQALRGARRVVAEGKDVLVRSNVEPDGVVRDGQALIWLFEHDAALALIDAALTDKRPTQTEALLQEAAALLAGDLRYTGALRELGRRITAFRLSSSST